MGGYFTLIAIFLAINADRKHKLTARLLACEFVAMWAIHYFGHVVFDVIGEPELYLVYILAQMPILFMMWLTHCSIFVRRTIMFTIGYNVLVISQYTFDVIEFYGNYPIVMRIVMALQLAYLLRVTGYVSSYRRSKRPDNFNNSGRVFNVRNRMGFRG